MDERPTSPGWGPGAEASTMIDRSRLGVAAFGMARQPVVGDRLPRRPGADELGNAGAGSGVLVQRAHADADRIGVAGVAAEQRRAAVAAEPLLAALLGSPDAQPVLALDDSERVRRGVCVGRRGGAAAALAAAAMAVARGHERRGHLVAHGAAVAAARER